MTPACRLSKNISTKGDACIIKEYRKGKLVPAEPYDTCCHFSGPEDDFTIELSKIGGSVKISGLMISKKRA